MKKIILSIVLIISVLSCKGPGSGPLAKESFEKKEQKTEPQGHSGVVKAVKASVTVNPCQGCIKIADLISNKKSYSGKSVKVTGAVTKFNSGIMGKNWVHIQDGSESHGEIDLTITTDGYAELGKIVTFEGTISLDKDFGYGYFYKIIMEDGKLIE